MALHNNPYLYTEGAERFNSRPSVNLYAQLKAREQARTDAFDEYIRSLNKNVNSAGLRNQDRQAFDEKLAAWQKYGMENRDAIRGRKGGADMQFQQQYQDLLNTVAESKQEEEKKKPIVEILLDPNKRDRIDEEGVMKSVHAHDLPIWKKNESGQWERDQERKSIDYNSFSFNPKMYTPEQWQKYDESLTKSIPSDKTDIQLKVHPTDRYSQIESTSATYSPQKLAELGDKARSDFASDQSLSYTFKKTHPYEKWVKDNGKEFDKLNSAFKSAYGPDANIQDDDDLFAATKIQSRLQPTITEKRIDNWGARDAQNYNQQIGLENLRNKNALGRIRFRDSLDDEKGEEGSEEMINAFKDAYTEASDVAPGKIGAALTRMKAGTQAILIDKAKKLLGKNDIGQESIFIKKSGTNKIDIMGIFDNDPNDPKKGNHSQKLGSVDFTDMNIPANTPLGVKARREVVEQAKNNKPSGTSHKSNSSKPKKVVQNGVEYTLNEATGNYE